MAAWCTKLGDVDKVLGPEQPLEIWHNNVLVVTLRVPIDTSLGSEPIYKTTNEWYVRTNSAAGPIAYSYLHGLYPADGDSRQNYAQFAYIQVLPKAGQVPGAGGNYNAMWQEVYFADLGFTNGFPHLQNGTFDTNQFNVMIVQSRRFASEWAHRNDDRC